MRSISGLSISWLLPLLFALACGGGDAPPGSDAAGSSGASNGSAASAGVESAGDTLAGPAPESVAGVEARTGGPVPQDIVLVTIDTLRADAVGFMGNTEVRTPELDKIALEGRVYDRAYAHNVVTLPSHTNMLTGLYPHQHGVRENSGFRLGDDVPTLATLLGEAGFRTGAFIAAFPLDARYGLNRGFDVYDDQYPEGANADQFLGAERPGDEVVKAAVDWWDKNAGQKRFLWLHLYDPHAPYLPPEPWATEYRERPYLGEVAATDSYLEPLFSRLRPNRDKTLLVVTSDHGEALGSHGEQSHGLFCYEPTLRVPLVLWGGTVVAGRDQRLAGHVDFLPTILKTLDLPIPENVAGRDLLSGGGTTDALYFEALTTYYNRGWAPLRGVVTDSHKMIELPLPELYDLDNDPAETTNVVRDERRLFRDLREILPSESWPPAEVREVSAAEMEKLRSLGYLADTPDTKKIFSAEDDPKNLVDVDRKIHETIEAYSLGRYVDAVRTAQELVNERPDMVTGYEYMALSLRQLEKPAEAIAVLRSALDRGLSHATLLRQLGLTYAENGYAQEAIDVLSPMAESGDPETLNALGIALSDAGRHAEGLAVLRRGLELDPSAPKTLEALGVVTLRTGDAPGAQRFLEQALERNPRLPFCWNTLGVAHAYQGRTIEAMDAWENAVSIDGRQYDALYNLGMTALRTGQSDRARSALERYISIAPAERYAADIANARRALSTLR